MSVRNPLSGFALTTLGAAGLSFLVGLPVLFLPASDLVYFYLPFALFGVGLFAGRGTFLGSLGFIGAMIGGFLGTYVFQIVLIPQGWALAPAGWDLLLTLGFGAACGIGGLASGKIGAVRIERISEHAPKMRRCLKCGAKVGISARKCWSCHSSLPRT